MCFSSVQCIRHTWPVLYLLLIFIRVKKDFISLPQSQLGCMFMLHCILYMYYYKTYIFKWGYELDMIRLFILSVVCEEECKGYKLNPFVVTLTIKEFFQRIFVEHKPESVREWSVLRDEMSLSSKSTIQNSRTVLFWCCSYAMLIL